MNERCPRIAAPVVVAIALLALQANPISPQADLTARFAALTSAADEEAAAGGLEKEAKELQAQVAFREEAAA